MQQPASDNPMVTRFPRILARFAAVEYVLLVAEDTMEELETWPPQFRQRDREETEAAHGTGPAGQLRHINEKLVRQL